MKKIVEHIRFKITAFCAVLVGCAMLCGCAFYEDSFDANGNLTPVAAQRVEAQTSAIREISKLAGEPISGFVGVGLGALSLGFLASGKIFRLFQKKQ